MGESENESSETPSRQKFSGFIFGIALGSDLPAAVKDFQAYSNGTHTNTGGQSVGTNLPSAADGSALSTTAAGTGLSDKHGRSAETNAADDQSGGNQLGTNQTPSFTSGISAAPVSTTVAFSLPSGQDITNKSGASPGFGGSSAFGAQTPLAGGSVFGGGASGTTGSTGGGLFGSVGGTGFGQTQNSGGFGGFSSPGFGGSSAFGAQTPLAGGSVFGGGASGTTGSTGGGLFGSVGGTGFGQTQNSGGFGGFSIADDTTTKVGQLCIGTNLTSTETNSVLSSTTVSTGFCARHGSIASGNDTTTKTSEPSVGTNLTSTAASSVLSTTTAATGFTFGHGVSTDIYRMTTPKFSISEVERNHGRYERASQNRRKARAAVGTTVLFNPPKRQDTMINRGVTTNINTKHQCITAMKEYENKSLEELRMEDYSANRKSKQAGSASTVKS